MERQRIGASQSIELTMQRIITIYAIQNMMILKLGMRFVIGLGELSGIVNQTLRERIDKAIFEKLINVKVNFGFGAPIKAKKNPKMY